MGKEKTQPNQEELLKAVADVLDEALQTYDQLSKGEGIANAIPMDQFMGAGPGIVGEPTKEGHTEATELGVGEVEHGKPVEKEEDKKDKKDEDEDHEDEEDDEKLVSHYKSLVAKMEARGLIQKAEPSEKKKEKMQKSESTSIDERFEVLTKSLNSVSDLVKKLASMPAQRKGVTGYQPLKKNDSEDAPALRKSDVVDRLLELKKSGDSRVDSLLINRVETGRLTKMDADRIKALGVLSE